MEGTYLTNLLFSNRQEWIVNNNSKSQIRPKIMTGGGRKDKGV